MRALRILAVVSAVIIGAGVPGAFAQAGPDLSEPKAAGAERMLSTYLVISDARQQACSEDDTSELRGLVESIAKTEGLDLLRIKAHSDEKLAAYKARYSCQELIQNYNSNKAVLSESCSKSSRCSSYLSPFLAKEKEQAASREVERAVKFRQSAERAGRSAQRYVPSASSVPAAPRTIDPPSESYRSNAEQSSEAGISGVYCSSIASVLRYQTLSFRESGMPISVARDSFDTYLKDSAEAWRFAIASVQVAYANPEMLRNRLESGAWMSACVRTVRGF